MNKNQLFRYAIIRDADEELTPDALAENADSGDVEGLFSESRQQTDTEG